MKQLYYPILFIFLLISFLSTAQVDCNLTYLTTIEGFVVYEHDASGAIIFRAKMAIDADGCPRAYGPNNSGLDWTANAGYPGNWWGIVTDANGDPIIQGSSDPYPGMYVSTTSLVQSGYSNTNPLRYVDSENIPYIALPSALQSLAGIQKGDLAYARNTTNGNTSFAYFADTGPGGKLGEGSMFLADELGLNSSPKTGGTSQGIIDYIVFPGSGLGNGTHLTIAQINSMGQSELTAAGGAGVVDCIDSHNPLDCSNTIPLTCGVTYSGASSSDPSLVGSYGCNTWSESGPERIHSIVPSGNGTITATLSNFTGDLDVYILGSCDPNDCLGTVSSSSASYSSAVAGQTYYIVVDADDGSGSAYDLVVDCPVSSSSDNVLLVNEMVSSTSVVAGDDLTLSVDQNYTGSQSSSSLADVEVAYYLSEDCNWSADDSLLGADVSNIGSDNTSSSESSLVTIPSSTSPGSYYVLLVADHNNDIAESNEGDNVLCVAITVTPLVLNCSSAVSLTCGVTYHGASSSASSNVDTYGCNSWTETGPERIHSITPSSSGTLAATVSNYTGDLDVYILASCDPNDCVGSVSSSAATLTNAIGGHTYYIVVDADDGSGSAYDLVVSCPTVQDDIHLQNEILGVTHADTSEVVSVDYDLVYNGTQSSSSLSDVQVSYYVSANCVLDGGDVLVGSDVVNIGSDIPTVFVNGSLTVSNLLAAGNYNVIISADDTDVILESDENNNTTCKPITVCRNAHGVFTHQACDSYQWVDGSTYSSSNNSATYSYLSGASYGCDSLVTLDLTIKNSSSSAFTETGCLSFESPSGNYVWTQSGTFKDTILNAVGCDSVMTITVDIINPDEQITQQGNILEVAANDAYAWVDCNDAYSVISGENSQQFVASQDGAYAVVVSQNGCQDTSSCYSVVGTDVSGIAENSIVVYPNPIDKYLNIQLDRSYGQVLVVVEELNGRLIFQKQYGLTSFVELGITAESGIYLVTVYRGGEDPVSIKVVKK